jgi:hypothetical protein
MYGTGLARANPWFDAEHDDDTGGKAPKLLPKVLKQPAQSTYTDVKASG